MPTLSRSLDAVLAALDLRPTGTDRFAGDSIDVTILAAALAEHGIAIGVEDVADRLWDGVSFDHAVWFHRPVRADEWLLFEQSSRSAARGRAFARADVFGVDGRLVASVAQEGLFLVR